MRTNPDFEARIIKHFSDPRMLPYLNRTENPAEALRLYQWNSELSGAFSEELGYVEVALRNAMDRQLKLWNPTRFIAGSPAYGEDWIKNPAVPLYAMLNRRDRKNSRIHSTYETAFSRALSDRHARPKNHPRQQADITHDDLVAHLTFGTWAHLLPVRQSDGSIGPKGKLALWKHSLKFAFPNKQDPLVISNWVFQLHKLRNRIAHRENLLDINVRRSHRTAIRLLKAIDSQLGDWVSGNSRVSEVIKARPA